MSVEAWLIILFWVLAFGGVICWAVEKAQTPKPSKKPVTAQEPAYVPRHNAKTRAKQREDLQAWSRLYNALEPPKPAMDYLLGCTCDRESQSSIDEPYAWEIVTRRDPNCRTHRGFARGGFIN